MGVPCPFGPSSKNGVTATTITTSTMSGTAKFRIFQPPVATEVFGGIGGTFAVSGLVGLISLFVAIVPPIPVLTGTVGASTTGGFVAVVEEAVVGTNANG